jgi:V8-like Glu-specific endopeptidase
MINSRIAMLGVALSLTAGSAMAQAYYEVENRTSFASVPFSSVEARRAAEPMAFPDFAAGPGGTRYAASGEPSVSQGQAPVAGSMAEAQAAYPDQWAMMAEPAPADAMAGDTNFAGAVGVFTQYCENCDATNTNYPQIAMGRLFIQGAGGGGQSTCSATVIGEDLIVTAAHCCYSHEAGAMNDDFAFVPAYRDGAAPVGVFDWSRVRVLGAYRNNPRRSNDICLIRLLPDQQNRQVSYYTGWLGTALNFGYWLNLHAVGYPGNIGGGEFMELCTATTSRPPRGCDRNAVLNMGCSMTYGASGGGWLLHYRNGNYVTSVVSGYDSETCTGEFGTMFNGPLFQDNNFGTPCGTWC